MTITSAMILAAGLGQRMRPVTETRPKPLVEVAGKPLIAYALEALGRAGVDRIVVNVHYLAPMLVDWLGNWPGAEITISDETEALLDSGGGIARALPLLGQDPFLVLNADTFWMEEPGSADNLTKMIGKFDRQRMDMLMLTARPGQATGHEGDGDFIVGPDGRLQRYRGQGDPVIYAGALVLDPRVLAPQTDARFSLNRCFDSAISAGRLYAEPMHGHWLTVGTPRAIGEAEDAMAAFHKSRAS